MFALMTGPTDKLPIERTITVDIKLYYDLLLPAATPAPLLIALHGYGANKRQMMREAKLMASPEFAIASLQGFHQHIKEPREQGGPLRFGFGWVTNFHSEDSQRVHHQAVIQLIEKNVAEGTIDPTRIFLVGFSQSCALNYRFAFTHPDYLRGVIGICGGLPGDWDTSQIYKPTAAAVLHLAGNRDEFYPPSKVADYAERLRLRTSEVEMRSYDAEHEFVPEMNRDIREWLTHHRSVSSDYADFTDSE